MGEGERCKTAADRFTKLRTTTDLFGEGITLKAIEDAFSVDKLSKTFFDEYRRHYGRFTKYLTGKDENNKEVGKPHPFLKSVFNGHEKEARDFIKKMLGRIVFLYFLEKKGWLGVPEDKSWGHGDENFLSNLFRDCNEKENFYQQVLVPLYFNTLNEERPNDLFKIKASLFSKPGYNKLKIPYLNGGLFDDDEKHTDNLVFPQELFAELFNFFDQYNFTVYEDSPDEHTVAVDPEMLGHIFENLLEDNKDKGAYYTPKEIVHYMCRESLIEYLYTKLNPQQTESFKEIGNKQTDMFGNKARTQLSLEESVTKSKENVTRTSIEKLVLHHEASEIIEHDEAILKALKEVKICDPAIGSGAFPMGLLLEIFHLVETLYDVSPDVTAAIWKLGKGWNPAKVKEEIIQNSIYGVDIEKGAVDIARLRFWLSLIVDENSPRPLPNLDYKIVVGDSLLSKFEDEVIDIDWTVNMSKGVGPTKEIMKEQELKLYGLQHRQHLYFHVKGDKTKLQQEIRNLKIDILINQLTLSKLSFLEANPKLGGFSPTPKEIQKNLENEIRVAGYDKPIAKLKKLKESKAEALHFFDWKLDFPEVMNEKVVKGNVGFDILIGNPPYVSSKDFNKNLIELLIKKYETSQYQLDLYVAFIEKGIKLSRVNGVVSYITPNSWLKNMMFTKCRSFLLNNTSFVSIVPNLENVFVASVDSLIFILKKLVKDNQIKVYQFEDFKPVLKHRVLQSRFASNDRFVFDVETNEDFFSIIQGVRNESIKLNDVSEISRGVNPYDKARGQSEEVIRNKIYHADNKKTKTFVPELRGKHVGNYYYKWDEKHFISYGPWLAAPREEKYFSGPRIIMRQVLGEKLNCTIITEDFIIDQSVFIARLNKNAARFMHGILGVLASKLISQYFRHTSNEFDALFPKIKIGEFRELPVYKNLEKANNILSKNVAKILSAKKKDLKTSSLERQVDILVYKLYKLTYNEASLVEGNTDWMTMEEYEKFKIE
ncbi:MAG: TaqI-like C-terminal specificity domain-containing protein [Chitinophagaceae bacterium]|nr:TaqI-like C-terminal specificity domain-containing protein [Chitinophagaceae bacterium]